MSSLEDYIDILESVLRDAGQEMWQVLDRIISAKNDKTSCVEIDNSQEAL